MKSQSCTSSGIEPRVPAPRSGVRSIARARHRREQVLATLAFLTLIAAWDASSRLDDQVSPPRMRLSHAVEQGSDVREAELIADRD